MCTVYALATLLLATFSVVEAKTSAEDSQGVAFTATWPAKTGNNPWSKLCIQTHANVPVYTMVVAALQAVGMTIWEIGYPHSALGKTCRELGFKELGFDRKTCAEDPDCRVISDWLVDVTLWTNGDADATDTLGKVVAHPNLISMLQEGLGHADSHQSNDITMAKNSAGVSQGVAFTATWPAKTGNNPWSKLCIQTHANVPVYTFFVAALQAVGMTIWEIGYPHSALGKTCPELGFKELGFDQKTCAEDPACKHISGLLVDVTLWTNGDTDATDTLGKVNAQPNLISMLQEGRADSQASNHVVMV